jgi:phosphopantetheinyl transferase (holo-ACP synthase)
MLREFAHAESLAKEREKRYMQRFEAADEAVAAALTAAKEAVLKAESATEKRFDSVNEFRGALADQAATLMPRFEADSRLNALETALGDVAKAVSVMSGRGSGLKDSWGYLVGAVGIVAALVALLAR